MTRKLSIITLTFCFLSLPFLFSACDDDEGPTGTTDPTELEGAWSGYIVGMPNTTVDFVMAGKSFVYKSDGVEAYRGTFTLNTSVTPKTMDAYITQSQNSQYVGKTSLSIYQLSNDTATIAGNEPGNTQRPTSFTPIGGTAVMVMTR